MTFDKVSFGLLNTRCMIEQASVVDDSYYRQYIWYNVSQSLVNGYNVSMDIIAK